MFQKECLLTYLRPQDSKVFFIFLYSVLNHIQTNKLKRREGVVEIIRNLHHLLYAYKENVGFQVFAFADKYRGSYSNGLRKVVCPYYCSVSGYEVGVILSILTRNKIDVLS